MSDQLLIVITDPSGQRWTYLSTWRSFTIGRHESCELVLVSRQVSRRHVHLAKMPDQIAVTDLGGAAGTWLNGLRIEGRHVAPSGSVVEVGPYLIEVYDGDAEGPPDARPWPDKHQSRPVAPDSRPLAANEPGVSVRELIRFGSELGPFPIPLAVELGERLLAEVQRRHAEGHLVLRLPPEQIFVGPTGLVGLRLDPGATPVELAERYASPELLDRPDVDGRSDVFAAATVLYELLSDHHPYPDEGRGPGTLPLRGVLDDLRQHRAETPPGLVDLIDRALQPSPDDRPQTAESFRKALRSLIADGDVDPLDGPIDQLLQPYFERPAPETESGAAADAGSDAPFQVRVAVIADDETTESYSFPGEGVIAIGRHSSNDLVVLSLKLSRWHARLKVEPGGRLILSDLGSANGTWVNGREVRRPTAVAVGDRIEMGGVRFTIAIDEAPAPHLYVVLDEPDVGERRLAFHGRQKLLIGSDASADIVLADAAIEVRHARLIVWGDKLQLEALAPAVTVGGEPLDGPARLISGADVLGVAGIELRAALDNWPEKKERTDVRTPADLLPALGELVPSLSRTGARTFVGGEPNQPELRFACRMPDAGPSQTDAPGHLSLVESFRRVKSLDLFPVVGAEVVGDELIIRRPALPGLPLALALERVAPGREVAWAIISHVASALAAVEAEVDLRTLESPLTVGPTARDVFVRADGRALLIAPAVTESQRPTTPVTRQRGLGRLLAWLLRGSELPPDDKSAEATLREVREHSPAGADLLELLLAEEPMAGGMAAAAEALAELAPLGDETRLATREWLQKAVGLAGDRPGHPTNIEEHTDRIELPGMTVEEPNRADEQD